MENEPRRFGYISRQTNLNAQQSDSLVGINKNILNANIIENGYIETEDHANELGKLLYRVAQNRIFIENSTKVAQKCYHLVNYSDREP
jgi:hypothetical protein